MHPVTGTIDTCFSLQKGVILRKPSIKEDKNGRKEYGYD
jgi:hypothetical protein